MSQTTISLNEGQQAAADAFLKFLFSPETEFNISGAGGVGKTHLMGHLIDQTIPSYINTCRLLTAEPMYDEVIMTATTNKAADELGKSTGRPAQTIHSYMGLRVKDNYSTGDSELIKTSNFTIKRRKIIFIDECSMVDSRLYALIHEGTDGCKIVWVGDHCQLAPVKEKISPVYRKIMPLYELTEPMRNSGQPALIALCSQMRNTVKSNEFLPIQVVPGVIDYFDNQQMEAEVNSCFIDNSVDARILAYQNTQVTGYNQHIRELRQLPATLGIGENLINHSAISLSNGMLSIDQEVTIENILSKPFTVHLDDDIDMDVMTVALKTTYGETFILDIPINRDYFIKVVKHYAKTRNWVAYFHAKGKYPDLRERDSSTVHKAQGSSLGTVFIDLSDLSTCTVPDTVARLLYVAVSRARKRIILYGDLKKTYGSVIR